MGGKREARDDSPAQRLRLLVLSLLVPGRRRDFPGSAWRGALVVLAVLLLALLVVWGAVDSTVS